MLQQYYYQSCTSHRTVVANFMRTKTSGNLSILHLPGSFLIEKDPECLRLAPPNNDGRIHRNAIDKPDLIRFRTDVITSIC